ncbi:uncharacterized protein LOC135126356 [Zophobas morio]|uniref:uncharacterized protein LOC135126356 n=1 Tax=Zophobas morio TaxID=2755281 RepID=UPI003082AB9F
MSRCHQEFKNLSANPGESWIIFLSGFYHSNASTETNTNQEKKNSHLSTESHHHDKDIKKSSPRLCVCVHYKFSSRFSINLTKLEEPKGVTLLTHALLPRLDTCGWSMILRMAIGPKFFVQQYPWTALLVYQAGNQEKNYCGGTLISDRYVLTAAQCIKGNIPGLMFLHTMTM